MSKSKASTQDKRRRSRAGKSKGLVAIALVLSFLLAGVAMTVGGGPWSARPKQSEKRTQNAIENFSSPSKEYVYVSGRLVATEEPTIQTVFEGYVDGFGCGAIFGWAWDQNQPNSPINLDIYDGNTPIAAITANLYRRDLADIQKGNGFHGFIYTVPSSLKDGQTHSISVRYSGTPTNLVNSPRPLTCSSNAPFYQGYHDTTDCATIGGWAWDATQPYDPISVTIYDGDGGTAIATVMANVFRQDLLDVGIGNGYHGFSYPYPSSLKDGNTHQIYVKYTATGPNLGTTPMAMTCSGPWNVGNHDLVDCNMIYGWAWDLNHPNGRTNVDIYDGSTLLATVLASQFRQDLLNAGIGDGKHSFNYPLPPRLKDGQQHTIRVKFSGSTQDLGSTPKMITCF